MNDLYNNINPYIFIGPRVFDANGIATSGAMDLFNYRSAAIIITTGTIANAGGIFYFLLQEADLDPDTGLPGTFTRVPMNFIQTIYPETDETNGFPIIFGNSEFYRVKIYKVGYIGNKRFIRIQLAVTSIGATAGLPLSVNGIEGSPVNGPAPTNPNE
jgi:hypothetical protein